ncbi:structural maintenance of chromosomes protein [Parasponia andersonii]|uniref:Structural maintenance of chromosomes protein n=1 Tax=Parasponia andersonii TaxID=3476 RepID=A0A2P5ABU7_PARAD|nr:structural maintenance of chromosomes protein [Parasponia andersonii]
MASLMKPSSRYSSYDSRSSTSSHFSDPSSSTELKHKSPVPAQTSSSRALVKSKPSDLSSKLKSKPSDQNFTTMVKKFMEKRSNSSSSSKKVVGLVIPPDVIAEDLKRTARKGSNFGGLHRKLFGKGTSSSEKEKKEVKALTEVKGNTRTLAMVLRSERELLSLTKEQEMEISELKLKLEEKNTEVEKLKDLCLKQREEIKALKSAILFPDVVNSQPQHILGKQGAELKQAKQLIPTLQRQVTSLTGQLQCLADDLAEVKADKYSARSGYQNHGSSPRTPMYNHEEASNSLEFSSGDPASPGSPDEMLLKDLNPCLTPYYAKSRSKEFEGIGYDSPRDQSFSKDKMEFGFNSYTRKLSRSSDYCQNSKTGSTVSRAARRSDETKCRYRKQMHHKNF